LSHVENVWNNYGKEETYWPVLTDKKFLHKTLTQKYLNEFFESGKASILQIENTLRRCGVREGLNKKDCLEYGCGVGRVTIHLASLFQNVTGLDISNGHLDLAEQKTNTLNIKVQVLTADYPIAVKPDSRVKKERLSEVQAKAD
jgi:cyclopropane fatty-acyl-phospholipid synthase-like methyltransferase